MQLLWGYDDDKGEFILEHPHVKAIFGRKKNCPAKICHHNYDFLEI